MNTDLDNAYERLLIRASKKWGVDRHTDIIPIKEKLSFKLKDFSWAVNNIRLFKFNGRWGFCLSLQWNNGGWCYGPFLKFCDPYPTRKKALQAAASEIKLIHGIDKKIIKWAISLTQPKQLNLFN